jgi:hypothetical protein
MLADLHRDKQVIRLGKGREPAAGCGVVGLQRPALCDGVSVLWRAQKHSRRPGILASWLEGQKKTEGYIGGEMVMKGRRSRW